jgi:hypothetical protein
MLYRRQELWSHLAAPLERIRAFAQDVQGVYTAALKSCVESGRMQARIQAEQCLADIRAYMQANPHRAGVLSAVLMERFRRYLAGGGPL